MIIGVTYSISTSIILIILCHLSHEDDLSYPSYFSFLPHDLIVCRYSAFFPLFASMITPACFHNAKMAVLLR